MPKLSVASTSTGGSSTSHASTDSTSTGGPANSKPRTGNSLWLRQSVASTSTGGYLMQTTSVSPKTPSAARKPAVKRSSTAASTTVKSRTLWPVSDAFAMFDIYKKLRKKTAYQSNARINLWIDVSLKRVLNHSNSKKNILFR